MPAYAYPIKINREKQIIHFDEEREIESNSLTLAALQFIGDDPFSVHENEWGGYTISVSRSRLETDVECHTRVAREESYMAEYRKRHPAN